MPNTASETYRTDDDTAVVLSEATAEWVDAARPALLKVAKTLDSTITYQDLAEVLQKASGVRTGMVVPNWIPGILGSVAADCHRRGEPLLSALCVQPDGTIGDAYAAAVAEAYGTEITTDVALEAHAAEERGKCYLHFGAVQDAAETPPAPAKKPARKRAAAPRVARGYVAPQSCPICSMVLPLAGRCVNCVAGR